LKVILKKHTLIKDQFTTEMFQNFGMGTVLETLITPGMKPLQTEANNAHSEQKNSVAISPQANYTDR
jgi:hypothetical protein